MDADKLRILELNRALEQSEQEKKALRKALRFSEEKLAAALDGTDIKIWQLDVPSQQLKVFNAPWGELLGFQPHEVEASVEGWKGNLHPDDRAEVVSAFEAHIRGESDAFQVVHRMIRKDGSDSWISDRGRVIEFDDNNNPLRMMGAHCNITQEKRYESQLSQAINRDPLTGLMNRSELAKEYNAINKEDAQECSLIFIELDNFKQVNDQHGHKFGDIVICYIAEQLKKVLIDESFICRLDGDKFVVLKQGVTKAALGALCNALIAPFRSSIIFDSKRIKIGLSIGIHVFSDIEEPFDNLCQKADQAMLKVKNRGMNNYGFFE